MTPRTWMVGVMIFGRPIQLGFIAARDDQVKAALDAIGRAISKWPGVTHCRVVAWSIDSWDQVVHPERASSVEVDIGKDPYGSP